ncbi:hypothetical protein YB2330_003645 [Saitoella coloradoensis]
MNDSMKDHVEQAMLNAQFGTLSVGRNAYRPHNSLKRRKYVKETIVVAEGQIAKEVESLVSQEREEDTEDVLMDMVPMMDGEEEMPEEWSKRLEKLWKRVQHVGQVPLMPNEWKLDFQGFPRSWFVPVGWAGEVPLSAVNPSLNDRGAMTFKRLATVGQRVREKLETNREERKLGNFISIDKWIRRDVNHFMNWIQQDTGLQNVFCTVVGRTPRESRFSSLPTSAERTKYVGKLTEKLRTLAKDLNETQLTMQAMRTAHPGRNGPPTPPADSSTLWPAKHHPTLYGLCILGPIILITYVSTSSPALEPRPLFHLDLSEGGGGSSVVNGIKIALVMLAARDEAIWWEENRLDRDEVKDAGNVGKLAERLNKAFEAFGMDLEM